MSEQGNANEIYERLQVHVPFLKEMIDNLKIGMPQHNKIVALHNMITNKKRKFKYETLKKCEEVILKMKAKTNYKVQPKSPNDDENYTIDSPDPEVSEHIEKQINRSSDRYVQEKPSVYSSAAETVGKSNTYDRLVPIVPALDTSKPPISVADLELLKSDDVDEVVAVAEPPKVEEKVVFKKESKISLVPAPIIKPRRKPDKSKEKVCEEKVEKKVESLKTEKCRMNSSSTVHKNPSPKKDAPGDKMVEKVIKDSDSIFWSLLSSIDDKIRTQKRLSGEKSTTDKRLNCEKVSSEKREKRINSTEKTTRNDKSSSSLSNAKDKGIEPPVTLPKVLSTLFIDIEKPKLEKQSNTVKDVAEDVKPLSSSPVVASPEKVYKRLADKYNPKPRKPNAVDVPKPAEESVILKPGNTTNIPFISPNKNSFEVIQKVDPRKNNFINKTPEVFPLSPQNGFNVSNSPVWHSPMDTSDSSSYGNTTPIYTNPLDSQMFPANKLPQNRPNFPAGALPAMQIRNNAQHPRQAFNFIPPPQQQNQNQRPQDPRLNQRHIFAPFEPLNNDFDTPQDPQTSPYAQSNQFNRNTNPYNSGAQTPNPYNSTPQIPNPYNPVPQVQNSYNPGSQTPNPYNSGPQTPNPFNSGSQTPNPYNSGSQTPNPYSNAQNSFIGNNVQYATNFQPYNGRFQQQQNFQYNNRFNRDMETPSTYKSWREERESRDPRLSRGQDLNRFNQRDEGGGGRWQREKSASRDDRFSRGRSTSREDSRDDRFSRGKSITREDSREERFSRGKSIPREGSREDRFSRGKSITREGSREDRFSRGKSFTRENSREDRSSRREDSRNDTFSRGKEDSADWFSNEKSKPKEDSDEEDWFANEKPANKEEPKETQASTGSSNAKEDPRDSKEKSCSKEDPEGKSSTREEKEDWCPARRISSSSDDWFSHENSWKVDSEKSESRDQRGRSVSRDWNNDRSEQEKSTNQDRAKSATREKSMPRDRAKSITREDRDASKDLGPGAWSSRDEYLSHKSKAKENQAANSKNKKDKVVAKNSDSESPNKLAKTRVLRNGKKYVEEDSSESNSQDALPEDSKNAKSSRSKYDDIYSSLKGENEDSRASKKEVSLQSFKIPKKNKPEETPKTEAKEDKENLKKDKAKVDKSEAATSNKKQKEKNKTAAKKRRSISKEKKSDAKEKSDDIKDLYEVEVENAEKSQCSENEIKEKVLEVSEKEESVDTKNEKEISCVEDEALITELKQNATSNAEKIEEATTSKEQEVGKEEVTSTEDLPVVSSSTEVEEAKDVPVDELAKKMESQSDKLGLPPTVKEEFKKFISNISKSVGAPMPLLEMFGMLVDYIKPTDSAEASTSAPKEEDKLKENEVELTKNNAEVELPEMLNKKDDNMQIPSSSNETDIKESSESSSPCFKRKVVKKFKKGGKRVVKKIIEDDSDDDLPLDSLVEKNKKKMPPPKKARRSELDKLHEDIKETMGEGVLSVSNKRSCTIQNNLLEEDVKVDDTILEKVKDVKVVLQKLPEVKKAKRRLEIEPDESVHLPKRRSMNRNKTAVNYADEDETPSKPDEEVVIDIQSAKISEEVLKPPEETKVLRKRTSSLSPAKSSVKKKKIQSEKVEDESIENTKVVKTKGDDEAQSNKSELDKNSSSAQSESEIDKSNKSSSANNLSQTDSEDDSAKSRNVLSESEIESEVCYVEPDKNHCLVHNTDAVYKCKICAFEGSAIVDHYAIRHPKIGCVISRLSPENTELACKEAEEEDLEDIELLDKRSKHYFRCRFCLHAFEEVQSLYFYNHLTKHTGEFRFKCAKCHYKTSERKALGVHYLQEHNIEATYTQMTPDFIPTLVKKVCGYICSECNFLQLNKFNVEEHIQIYHLDDTACVKKVNMSLKREKKKTVTKNKKVKKVPDNNSAMPAEILNTIENINNVQSLGHVVKVTSEKIVDEPKDETVPKLKDEPKVDSKIEVKSEEKDVKMNELDKSVFMCDTDIEDETIATRLEKMKEINESVTPRRISIINKLKDRFDQEFIESKKDPEITKNEDGMTVIYEGNEETQASNAISDVRANEDYQKLLCDENLSSGDISNVTASTNEVFNDDKLGAVAEPINDSSEIDLNKISRKSEKLGMLKLRNDLFANDTNKEVVEMSDNSLAKASNSTELELINPVQEGGAFITSTTANTSTHSIMLNAFPQAVPSITLNSFSTTVPSITLTTLPVVQNVSLLKPIPVSSATVLNTPFMPTLNAIPLSLLNTPSPSSPIIAISTFPTPKTVTTTTSQPSPSPPQLTPEENTDLKPQPNLLPKLSKVVTYSPPNSDQVEKIFTASGVSIILNKNKELRYECKKSCVFVTSSRDLFESHCTYVHRTEKIIVNCGECDIKSVFNREQVFKHLCKHVDDALLKTSDDVTESIVISDDEEPPKFSFKIAQVESLAARNTSSENPPVILNSLSTDQVSHVLSFNNPQTTSTTTTITNSSNGLYLIQPKTPKPKMLPDAKVLTCRIVPLTEEELMMSRKDVRVMDMWTLSEHWGRLFKCPYYSCLFTASTEEQFQQHLETHTFSSLVPCLYCNYKMKIEYYTIHLVVRHRYCKYGCPYCLYRAINEDYVKFHVKGEHPDKEQKVLTFNVDVIFTRYRCPPLKSMKDFMKPYVCKCSKKYYAKENFTLHLKTCPENTVRFIMWNVFEYSCRYCNFSGPAVAPFLEHMSKHHPYHPICIVTRHLKDEKHTQEDEDAMVFENLKKITSITPEQNIEPTVVEVPNAPQADSNENNSETNPQVEEAANNKENLDESTELSAEDMEEDSVVKTGGYVGCELFKCAICKEGFEYGSAFRNHLLQCGTVDGKSKKLVCVHCDKTFKAPFTLVEHIKLHGIVRIGCSLCAYRSTHQGLLRNHMKLKHKILHCKFVPVDPTKTNIDTDEFIARPATHRRSNAESTNAQCDTPTTPTNNDLNSFGPDNIHLLPIKSIFNYNISCNLCNFQTKVRMNFIRHMSQHEQGKETTAIAPVNPVPCLEKNELMFDKMTNLASSSHAGGRMGGKSVKDEPEITYPSFIPSNKRYVCGAALCNYLCLEEAMLKRHLQALHTHEDTYICAHCKENLVEEKGNINVDLILKHLRLHDQSLYKCSYCPHMSNMKAKIEKHCGEKHSEKSIKIITARELIVDGEVASGKEGKKKPWKCAMCKGQFSNKEDARLHAQSKHAIDSQYKCSYCTYKSDDKNSFNSHFEKDHKNMRVDYIVSFYYSDGECAPKPQEENTEAFDTTPLWLKNKNYVRHIRGILIEDQPKLAKKSPIKLGPLPTLEKVDKKIVASIKEDKEKKEEEVVKEIEKDNIKKEIDTKDDVEEKMATAEEKKVTENIECKNAPTNLDLSIEAVATGNFTVATEQLKVEEVPKVIERNDPPLSEIHSMAISKLRKQNYMGEFGRLIKPFKNRYKCPLCMKFSTPEVNTFEMHLCKDLKYFKHGCQICDYADVSLTSIQEHILKDHPNQLQSQTNWFVSHPVNKAIEDWMFKLRAFQYRFIKEYTEKQQKSQAKVNTSPTITAASTSSKSEDLEVERLTQKDVAQEDSEVVLVDEDQEDLLMELKREDADCEENKINTKSLSEAVKPFKCSVCKFNSMNYLQVKKHITLQHMGEACIKDAAGNFMKKAINSCFYCKLDSVHRKYLINHHRHRHPDKELAIMCHQDVNNIVIQGGWNADRFQCGHCNYVHKEFQGFKEHYFEKHVGEDFNYIEFGVVPKIMVFQCNHCEMNFKDNSKLKEHMASQHTDNNVKDFKNKKGALKQTARKSTVDLNVTKTVQPFSFYGEKPDLTAKECQDLKTEIDDSGVFVRVAQYSKMVNIFPELKLVDCMKNAVVNDNS